VGTTSVQLSGAIGYILYRSALSYGFESNSSLIVSSYLTIPSPPRYRSLKLLSPLIISYIVALPAFHTVPVGVRSNFKLCKS